MRILADSNIFIKYWKTNDEVIGAVFENPHVKRLYLYDKKNAERRQGIICKNCTINTIIKESFLTAPEIKGE